METLEQAYRAHAETVYRWLLLQTRSPDLAEELTQETFYRVVRCVGRYDGSCQMSTWLCSIAKNVLHEHGRRAVSLPLEEMAPSGVPSVEEDWIQQAKKLELMAAMHRLPEPGREVLYLRLFGELSFREIGEILGRTENWARVTYYRAKEKLSKELIQDEP